MITHLRKQLAYASVALIIFLLLMSLAEAGAGILQ